MFKKAVPSETKNALALLSGTGVVESFYLAGGTAIALQLGHRFSYDLDFFTQKEFDSRLLLEKLRQIREVEIEKTAWGTILGHLRKVKFSFFYYKYPLLFSLKSFGGAKIADARDVAPMKLSAICDRGTKRDFIDLYFLLKSGLSLKKILGLYDQKFGKLASNLVYIRKSLVYFADAEEEETPYLLKKVTWEEVKDFVAKKVEEISWELISP